MTDATADAADPFRRDGSELREQCVSFIESEVEDAGANGVVVVLAGGADSSAVATLAVEALGPDRVYGLVLPSSKIGSRNAQDAEAVAEALGIETDTIHLQPLLMRFGEMVPERADLHGDPIVRDNLVARLRTTMAYLAADATDALVVGAATRTDLLLGSVAEHGDGAADLLPLGGLYGTEAGALASALELPAFVTEPRPAAGQYPRRDDGHGIDAPTEAVDRVLYRLVDSGWSPERIRSEVGLDPEVIDRIVEHRRATERERRQPAVGPGSD